MTSFHHASDMMFAFNVTLSSDEIEVLQGIFGSHADNERDKGLDGEYADLTGMMVLERLGSASPGTPVRFDPSMFGLMCELLDNDVDVDDEEAADYYGHERAGEIIRSLHARFFSGRSIDI